MRPLLMIAVLATAAAPARADTWHSWTPANPGHELTIGDPAKDFCFLAGIESQSGDTNPMQTVAHARVIRNADRWVLYGSVNWPMKLSAVCVPLSTFTATGTARWISPPFVLKRAREDGKCAVGTANAWWGDAFTAISGVKGQTEKMGFMAVTQSPDPSKPSSLLTYRCKPGWPVYSTDDAMFAYSYFVGKPQSGQQPRFIGPGGIGTAAKAGAYKVESPQETVTMAPVATSVCFLTHIGGHVWNGRLALGQQGGNWTLSYKSFGAPGGNHVAEARCVLRAQA